MDSQQFIETQFDEGPLTYTDFCKIDFGERVPLASTQQPRGEYIKEAVSPAPELILVNKNILKAIVELIQNLKNSHERHHNELKEQINILKNGQKTLMTEFIKLKDNRLNIRHYVDSENCKFVLPFNELNSFIEFDATLLTDKDSTNQLKSIYMKQPGLNFKTFMRSNLKTVFTDNLAQQFTLKGRQGNLSAKNFNVITLLNECAISKFNHITKEDCHNSITKYFYYVKDKIAKTKKQENVPSGPSTSLNIIN